MKTQTFIDHWDVLNEIFDENPNYFEPMKRFKSLKILLWKSKTINTSTMFDYNDGKAFDDLEAITFNSTRSTPYIKFLQLLNEKNLDYKILVERIGNQKYITFYFKRGDIWDI